MIDNKLGIQPELREEVIAIQTLTESLTLPMAEVQDLAVDATLPTTVTKVNALLAAPRTAGLLDTGV